MAFTKGLVTIAVCYAQPKNHTHSPRYVKFYPVIILFE